MTLISEKHRSLLISSNVGVHYHNMSLAEYPGEAAKEVSRWISSDMEHDMSIGRNLCIVGTSPEAYDLAQLAVRGMIIRKRKLVHVYQVPEIIEDEDIDSIYKEYPFLAVTNIDPRKNNVDLVNYNKIESLLHRYIDRNYPIVLHFNLNSLTELPEDTAISALLASRIQQRFKIIQV